MICYMSRTHGNNRVASGNGDDISTGDDARARLLYGRLDVVNNIKSPGGVAIWNCPFLSCEGRCVVEED